MQLHYVMVKEGDKWKVDDIIYEHPMSSFRYEMTKPVSKD